VSSPAAPRPDLATLVTLFGGALRRAGLPVSTAETGALARVLELCVPATVDELYWCARVSLLRSVDSVAQFDALFAMVFRGVVDVAGYRGQSAPASPEDEVRTRSVHEPGAHPAPVGSRPRVAAAGADNHASTRHALQAIASSQERLTRADFGQLGEDELRALAPLLHRLLTVIPKRLSRRRQRSPRGDLLDVRATLRRSTRSGGDPSTVVRIARRHKPRRLVVLLDVSGSMEPYARAYLHLLWGAAARADAEVFVFGTRLTRLTAALRLGGPDLALRRAVSFVPDWAGGTRIGHALQLFMDQYGRRGMAHGSVVIIVSDGWERDDPAVLRTQMRALAARAHRVVWVNPRAAAAGFAPQTGGMSAALPFVDALVSGHSAEAFVDVVEALSRPTAGPGFSAMSAPQMTVRSGQVNSEKRSND
jgi:uncharacterized protein with von Willebrand factor type A (vWA) domain